jgi:hypothetical protein
MQSASYISWSDLKNLTITTVNPVYFSLASSYLIISRVGAANFTTVINKDGGADQTNFETSFKDTSIFALSDSTALDNVTKTSTGAGTGQINSGTSGAIFTIVTSAVSGTSPTLTAQLQYSYDGGTTWVNIPGAVTASITAAATTILQVKPGAVTAANQSVSWILPKVWRFNYTIGGTTPSFTIRMYANYSGD